MPGPLRKQSLLDDSKIQVRQYLSEHRTRKDVANALIARCIVAQKLIDLDGQMG
jgi:hypothetical protein